MVRVAYVKWLDAESYSGPRLVSNTKNLKGSEVESAGILLSQDNKAIRIAQGVWAGDDSNAGFMAREIEVIPQKYVISKQIFEVKEK